MEEQKEVIEKIKYQDESIQAVDFIKINNCAIIQKVVKNER